MVGALARLGYWRRGVTRRKSMPNIIYKARGTDVALDRRGGSHELIDDVAARRLQPARRVSVQPFSAITL